MSGLFRRTGRIIRDRWRDSVALSTIDQLAARIGAERPDIVSVDVFDTLIYRELVNPEAVFEMQFGCIGEDLRRVGVVKGADWLRLRKATEAALCESSVSDETTISDIYRVISQKLDIPSDVADRWLAVELECERAILRPYRPVIEFLNQIQQQGVRLVINTDTYLPRSFIESTLGSFGLSYLEVLCSSETNAPKRNGLSFSLLLEKFPGTKIFHFGDNWKSDFVNPRKVGIGAAAIRWQRESFLRQLSRDISYSEEAGFLSEPAPEKVEGVEAVAHRWGDVLADFSERVLEFARDKGVTDIWLLSRDCESLFQAWAKLDVEQSVKYIYASRAAWYPVMAVVAPELFEQWVGRRPTSDDFIAGERAITYITGQLGASSRRVLMVDVGWKGRLQKILQAVLEPKVEVLGFYFSLEPSARRDLADRAGCFVEWDRAVFHTVAVEALMGFNGPSCVGYEGTPPRPIFRHSKGDVAPLQYCNALISRISALLVGPRRDASESLRERRKDTLISIMHFPDQEMAKSLSAWSIGTKVDGSDAVGLAGAKKVNVRVLFGLEGPNNPWPELGIASLNIKNYIIRAFQVVFYVRAVLKSALKKYWRV